MDNKQFIDAYKVCALWSSTNDEGEPLDGVFSIDDIHPVTSDKMSSDCLNFINANAADLAEYCDKMENVEWSGASRAGHDFWLTRNGHGAGFWDRGLGVLGDRLSKAAAIYKGFYLYVGDDNFIHGV